MLQPKIKPSATKTSMHIWLEIKPVYFLKYDLDVPLSGLETKHVL